MIPGVAPTPGFTVTGRPPGPTILFLHGFMGSLADWREATAALEGYYRCIAVDLPGHGASTGLSPESYAIEGATRALLDLLDGLGVERPVIAGYSMGGRLALYLALRHPDRLSGLFLESASPGLDDAGERAARRAADEQKAARLENGDFKEFLRDWYRQPLFAPLARDGGRLRPTIESRLRNDPNELAKSLRGIGTGSQPSLWEELSDLQTPTLAVSGGLDEKFVGILRGMERTSPRIRTVIVPNVGHDIHTEASAEYVALLRSFLDDL